MAVDVGVECNNTDPERLQNLRRRQRRHPVATVDGHRERGRRAELTCVGRNRLAVARYHRQLLRVAVLVPSDRVGAGLDARLDTPLGRAVVLPAVGKQFDTVVVGRVVARGEHQTVPATGGKRQRRCRHLSHAAHLGPSAGRASLYCRRQRRSGRPAVAPDHQCRVRLVRIHTRRTAHRQSEFRP
ncbi:MAG: hypothetical protein J07HX64_00273 [halophilic archaeon J07HX64]|nr:MAG: hypothetical protein J07HX64_00273 [halophilic archaeon J07HX64]